jgi:hypothetical protein
MQNERWVADRALLRRLIQDHPEWTQKELAAWMGRSLGWVKKWIKRFREATAGDARVLFGKPRGRTTPYPQTDAEVQERVVAIRDAPPENLRRVPGPKAILYYLARDPARPRANSDPASFDAHHLENPASSWSHRPSLAPPASADGTSSTDDGLANRFQRCFDGAC